MKISKLLFAGLLLLSTSVFAGEVKYDVGKHSKPPYPKFDYCDVVAKEMEPRYAEMNKRVSWFKNDVSLVAVRFADFKYVVDAIPGIVLQKTAGRTRHYKVLRVKVYKDQRSTLHTTPFTVRQLDSGVAYKTQLRKLLVFANPLGFDDFIDDLGWKFMSGGCEIYQINLNRLLPW